MLTLPVTCVYVEEIAIHMGGSKRKGMARQTLSSNHCKSPRAGTSRGAATYMDYLAESGEFHAKTCGTRAGLNLGNQWSNHVGITSKLKSPRSKVLQYICYECSQSFVPLFLLCCLPPNCLALYPLSPSSCSAGYRPSAWSACGKGHEQEAPDQKADAQDWPTFQ